MKIGELAKRSGLTAHTIRYYERIGLLPYADRNQSRHRDYDASILTWIEFLGRLKTTGMPIRDMLRYAALRERGVDGTEAERRELLERHRAAVRAHVAELQACLLVLDSKIAGYAGTRTRNKDHDAVHQSTVSTRKRTPGSRLLAARKPARARAAGTR
jgi:DNA-binding transcriptional MerR regulator